MNEMVHDEVVSQTQRTVTGLIQYREAATAPDSDSRLKSITLMGHAPGK